MFVKYKLKVSITIPKHEVNQNKQICIQYILAYIFLIGSFKYGNVSVGNVSVGPNFESSVEGALCISNT